jgi:oxygen-dependent protoporphyrinogen oxidase
VRERGHAAAPPPPFVTLAGGTGQLVDALVAAVRAMPSVEVRTGAAVERLEVSGAGAGVAIRLAGGERIRGEAAILATPAWITASLVEEAAPEASWHLRAITHGTTAVVNLGYRDDQLPDGLTGHGFVVADGEPLAINACTLSSRKWPGRAPDGTLLVRAFIGSGAGRAHEGSDESLIEAAQRDVAGTLGIRGRPILAMISRYPDAMPHYTVGHLGHVAAAEAALAPFPAVRLAGAAYRGAGLPDCISQGRAAAGTVADLLSRGGTPASA